MSRFARMALRHAIVLPLLGLACCLPPAHAQVPSLPAAGAPVQSTRPDDATIRATMRRATRFMTDEVATNGGYVWSYLPDMSRRWGELEATPTMIWVQPPGTATMGHLFLDAWHATGEAQYYDAAAAATDALLQGEKPRGGWHYFIDFAGAEATAQWYATIGRNAWRMEEFQHDWGNATFDDMGTGETMQLILRMAEIGRDPRYLAAARRSVEFVLASQYDNGGWPQRWPQQNPYVHHGMADYTGYITFNDDVARQNIEFLRLAYRLLGDARIPDAIARGMDIYVKTQQPAPQAGWGLQHTLDLKPAAARTYEPEALVTHTTADNVRALLAFYRQTGERRFIARVPDALDWLASVQLPAEKAKDGRAFPTYIEIGSNQALTVHRRGSNVVNGEYYFDHDPSNPLGHYGQTRKIDLAGLREEYDALAAMDEAEVRRDAAALQATARGPLPKYFMERIGEVSDLNLDASDRTLDERVAGLNAQGYWPTPLFATSHPYAGDGAKQAQPGDYATTRVGDLTDTSPYLAEKAVIGISTGTYIENMVALIAALRDGR
ncbi:MAG TPA: pectate lyase [Thermomonas sp.]|nr:pectate lyase [Thermomonas sp.]